MAKDPYRYFRIEAQELIEGLSRGLLELERGADRETVRTLLRLAHTLKGASRVVKRGDIGTFAHELEDVLLPHRESTEPVDRGTVDRALGLLDRVRELVANLDAPAETRPHEPVVPEPGDARVADARQGIRVEVTDLDAVLEGTAEAHALATSLLAESERLGAAQRQATEVVTDALLRANGGNGRTAEARRIMGTLAEAHRALQERVERLHAELTGLRATAADLRLVPARTMLGDLERVARDAARTLEKDVELGLQGGDTHLDARVLTGVRQALVHLVRNSIAHGIEARGDRETAGKPPVGRVDILVQRKDQRVSVECRDDGRGIDFEAVLRAASERGGAVRDVSPEDQRSISRLLLEGGLSTAQALTDVSGRGVGLEAVRHIVEGLEGEVALRSQAGVGTTVEILVPVSLSALPALAVRTNGHTVLLPLSNVVRTIFAASVEVVADASGERLVIDEEVLPYLRLGRALGRDATDDERARSVVVVEADGRRAALGVDGVGGVRSIVLRAIPTHAAVESVVSAAAFDADGIPQLVLAPMALVRAALEGKPQAARPPVVPRLPLLVIDDSLTTRMLEQSILESAGYEVDLAVSAEDGLEKARARRYGAFIVDVEMPGMNGFDFIAHTRTEPDLAGTPAILVTSRDDPEDKRRGMEVGARAYIVKGQFDQAELLESIRRLVG